MRAKLLTFLFVLLWVDVFLPWQALSQEKGEGSTGAVPQQLTLVQAVTCEEIKEHAPQNQAIVFSITNGKACCFTSFDPVPEKTYIYHNWFYRDKLTARIKLLLQPPRWSTFSRIQLREADRGPWRVEISDQKGTLLRIVRLSITD
jgi:hypothetical protein